MADLDTQAKRMSGICPGMPWRGIGAPPSGTIGQGVRQAIAFMYSGILAGVAVVILAVFTSNGSDYRPILHMSRVGKHVRRKRIVYVR